MVAEEQEQFRSRVVILKVAKKAHNYDDGQARVWFFRDRTPLRLKSEVKEYQMWTVFSQIESIDGKAKCFFIKKKSYM